MNREYGLRRVVMGFALMGIVGLLTACGSGSSSTTTAAAPPPNNVPRFAYVANYNDNTISIYSVNAATGQLRHNGYVLAGSDPTSVTVDPSGKFAYVANSSGTVSAYSINATTGALTGVGAAVPAGTNPTSVTVDPSGKFAYVANFGSYDVSAYSIDATTGGLTEIDQNGAAAGKTVAAGTNPTSVTVDPFGKFAYVTNGNTNDVSAYSINATTGALTNVGSIAAGTSPSSVTVDPSGKFAYVANQGTDNVSAYSIDATSGALTEIDQNGAAAGKTVVAGIGPGAVTIAPSGKFAYVANFGDGLNAGTVSAYSINTTTGALTSVGAVVPAGNGPVSVTVDSSGKFAYVANLNSNTVSVFSIDATSGVLTAQTTISGRNGAKSLAMTHGTTAVTYTPKFAYVANSLSNDVSAYTINATTGALTEIDQNGAAAGKTVAAGNTPISVSVDPSGKFAYVANGGSSNISVFAVNASTGVLTSVGSPVPAGAVPVSVTVDPSGKFAYAASKLSDDVLAYTIDASTGQLNQILCGGGAGCNVVNPLAGTAPLSVSVDPSGRFAYVANSGSNTVSAYTIDASTGALTHVICLSLCGGNDYQTGINPTSVTVDPSGKSVYVADSNGISAYTINANTGALTPFTGVAAGNAPFSITVDSSGKFAYVVNYASNDVSAFSIDATSGALAEIDQNGAAAGKTVAAGTNPYSITVDPSGKFAYVANQKSNNVSAYTINASTGALTSVGGTVTTGSEPTSITTIGTIH